MFSLTVPGKVFLIGEYGVLQGGTGLFAALKPGYTYEVSENFSRDWIHPDSPLGVYQRESGNLVPLAKAKLTQPHGLGSSTAELIAGVQADIERMPETKRLWAWYREFFPSASGADLVAQLEALKTGNALFEIDQGTAGGFVGSDLVSEIFVFQINPDLKLLTHEALKRELPKLGVKHLNTLVKKTKLGLELNSRPDFQAVNEFADILHSHGLETELAHETRLAFLGVPGVYAVKGCGAGLHDVFLVAAEELNGDLDSGLANVAQAFGLKSLGTLQSLLWK